MKLTVTELISKTELNDFQVRDISLDIENIQFKLFLEGCYWFENTTSKPKILENGGLIKVCNYNSFEARYFLPKKRLWYTLDYNILEMIGEVNETAYENGVLKLAGFGKVSGYWIEYLIKNGDYEISFEE